MANTDLAVVILSWNTKALTLACLRSLHAEQPRYSRRIFVVDNGSGDGSADAVAAEFPQVSLLRNATNRGYAEGNNQGAKAAMSEFAPEYVVLLNSDTEPHAGALDQCLDFLRSHQDYGAVAPRLINPDGSVQRACKAFPGLGTALCYDTIFGKFWPGSRVEKNYLMQPFDHLHSRDVDQPPGACFMMRMQEYLDMGGLDQDLYLFFNDVDLCKRLWQKGRKVHYLAEAQVMHHEGASTRGRQDFVVVWHRNRMSFYEKHYGAMVRPYMRLLVRLRGWEEWFRAGRRHENPEHRAMARRDLKTAVREILAS